MDPGASPTARALLTLELLQGSPGITADRLADKLGVSERAARRYVAILREAGIPIESVRGPYGGYHVGRGLRLPPLMFTAAEALGLVMAVLDGHHDAGDPTDPVGSALGKIVRALPEPVAAQAEAVRRSTAPAPDRGAARPDPGTTSTLVQACSDRRRVRLGYRSEAGSEWEHRGRPVGGRRPPRPVVPAVPLALRRRPAGLPDRPGPRGRGARRHLHARRPTSTRSRLLEEHLAVGWEYEVEVVIDAPLDAVAARLPRALGRLEPVDDTTTRLVGSTSNPWWYAEQLAAIPAPYRIVGGPELQETARVVGQRLLAAAGDATADEPGA